MYRRLDFWRLPYLAIALLLMSGGNVYAHFQATLFPVMTSNSREKERCRVGYVDSAGTQRIDFSFYYGGAFSEGLAAVQVQKGGKWGYIDLNGRLIISIQFDDVSPFKEGYARVEKDGAAYLIDTQGKKVSGTEGILSNLTDGFGLTSQRGKWGYVNRSGNLVIPTRFELANSFSGGLAAVVYEGRLGYINKAGEWVIDPVFDPPKGAIDLVRLPNFSEGLAVYYSGNGFGYIDKSGKVAISTRFQRAFPFSEGTSAVVVDGKTGYIDLAGETKIPMEFDHGREFSEGLAGVRLNGKWGFVDSTGRQIIPPKFDEIEPFVNGVASATIYASSSGKIRRGYIDRTGRYVYSWTE